MQTAARWFTNQQSPAASWASGKAWFGKARRGAAQPGLVWPGRSGHGMAGGVWLSMATR